MDLDFKKIVEPYFDEALTTLVKNVQINSVYDPLTVSTSSPYGLGVKKCFDFLKSFLMTDFDTYATIMVLIVKQHKEER